MTNKELVAAFFAAGYVDHDYDRLLELLSDDYIDNSPCAARGSRACADILRGTQALFPDMAVDLLDLIGDGDKVAVRARFSGTCAGTFCGVSAPGRPIAFEALEIFRVEDGRIAESWGYWPDAQIQALLAGK